jgi:tetratricopeptide (TPR) repeat protein
MALPGWAAFSELGLWRWLLLSGIAVLVVLALAVGGWSWYTAAHARGLRALAEATALARAAEGPQAAAAERDAAVRALEDLIARYSSAQVVAPAAYHLGNLRFEAKAYEAARAAYSLALAKGASGSVGSLCRLGIGYTWEAQGKNAEALAAYQAALRGLKTSDFLYEELLMNVARMQEQSGTLAEAQETYRRILRELPQSRRGDDIRARLATLETVARP